MGRGPTYRPETCPWAAMVAQGLFDHRQASLYRNGNRVPSDDRIALLRLLGYEVTVQGGRAVCERWPGMGVEL